MQVSINRFALKDFREKDGKSVPVLARLAGISYQFLYLVEAGEAYPKLETRERLAAALNVSRQSIEAQLFKAPEPAAEDVAA
jgi:transcriptional regulator with XRE-family HTH domain